MLQVNPLLSSRTVVARIPREAVHFSDEMFMTGTAAEITPVRSFGLMMSLATLIVFFVVVLITPGGMARWRRPADESSTPTMGRLVLKSAFRAIWQESEKSTQAARLRDFRLGAVF